MGENRWGARRSSPPVRVYIAAFVVYVALGLWTKTVVLNWIVGPLFLTLTLCVIPMLWQQVFGRGEHDR